MSEANKFVIIAKEHDRRTRDVYKQEEVTPVLYYSQDPLAAFAQGGVWLQGKARQDGGAAFSPHADRATIFKTEKEADETASDLVLSAGFLPGDLDVERLKEPKEDSDVKAD
jgi:hypothetical protein